MSAIRGLHHKYSNLSRKVQKNKLSFRANEMSVGISLVVIKIKVGDCRSRFAPSQ